MPVSLRYQALSRSSWSDVRTQVGPSWYRNRSNYGGKLSQAFRREGGLCWAINKAIYAEDIMKVANARAIKKADETNAKETDAQPSVKHQSRRARRSAVADVVQHTIQYLWCIVLYHIIDYVHWGCWTFFNREAGIPF